MRKNLCCFSDREYAGAERTKEAKSGGNRWESTDQMSTNCAEYDRIFNICGILFLKN